MGQRSDLVGPGHLAAVSVVVVAAADRAGVVVARVAETGEVTVTAGLELLGLAGGPVIAEAVSKEVAMAEVFHLVGVRHVGTAACQFDFHAYSGVAPTHAGEYVDRVDHYSLGQPVVRGAALVGSQRAVAARYLAGRGELAVAGGASC